ncbi:DUF4783 domain-containing protein [Pseudopedobacter saltans]|nr:DUF4783 domain-containing protein [Pseudopedobacter saltans]
MKKFFLLFFLTSAVSIVKADVIEEIAAFMKSGDVKSMSGYFAPTVELNILGQEEIYSNVQTAIILKDFFQKNPPKSSQIIHKVTSNSNYKFAVILLNTSKNIFRVSYELKITSGKFLIAQIRIEENKE